MGAGGKIRFRIAYFISHIAYCVTTKFYFVFRNDKMAIINDKPAADRTFVDCLKIQ